MIIGLGYKARSGKDTIADYLELEYWFFRTAFACKLKKAARVIFGFSEEQLYGPEKEAEDPFWQNTPRNILQIMGTECMRHGYREDIWIKAVERFIEPPSPDEWVITDVRFPNEASAIKSWGGYLVRVDRPPGEHYDAVKTQKHASETSMDAYTDWDYVIKNDGTLKDLETKVDEMVLHFRRLRG